MEQRVPKELLDLSLEEDIHKIERTHLFCSHIEPFLGRLDEALAAIAPRVKASTQMSMEPGTSTLGNYCSKLGQLSIRPCMTWGEFPKSKMADSSEPTEEKLIFSIKEALAHSKSAFE